MQCCLFMAMALACCAYLAIDMHNCRRSAFEFLGGLHPSVCRTGSGWEMLGVGTGDGASRRRWRGATVDAEATAQHEPAKGNQRRVGVPSAAWGN